MRCRPPLPARASCATAREFGFPSTRARTWRACTPCTPPLSAAVCVSGVVCTCSAVRCGAQHKPLEPCLKTATGGSLGPCAFARSIQRASSSCSALRLATSSGDGGGGGLYCRVVCVRGAEIQMKAGCQPRHIWREKACCAVCCVRRLTPPVFCGGGACSLLPAQPIALRDLSRLLCGERRRRGQSVRAHSQKSQKIPPCAPTTGKEKKKSGGAPFHLSSCLVFVFAGARPCVCLLACVRVRVCAVLTPCT